MDALEQTHAGEHGATLSVFYLLTESLSAEETGRCYRVFLTAAERALLKREALTAAPAPCDAARQGLASRSMARVLVRAGLASLTGQPPQSIHINHARSGEPIVSVDNDARAWCVSISHTEGFVVCAFAEGRRLGVDTECLDRKAPFDALAGRYFLASEYEAILAASGADKARRFFEAWTMKEAYAKSTGRGLLASRQEIGVQWPKPNQATAALLPPLARGDFVLSWLKTDQRYVSALSVSGPATFKLQCTNFLAPLEQQLQDLAPNPEA